VQLGGGGVENDSDVAEVRHRKQAVDAMGGGQHPHAGRARKAVGVGTGAHHGGRRQRAIAVQDLDHQVGADVA
jgi:hypothetical protein